MRSRFWSNGVALVIVAGLVVLIVRANRQERPVRHRRPALVGRRSGSDPAVARRARADDCARARRVGAQSPRRACRRLAGRRAVASGARIRQRRPRAGSRACPAEGVAGRAAQVRRPADARRRISVPTPLSGGDSACAADPRSASARRLELWRHRRWLSRARRVQTRPSKLSRR